MNENVASSFYPYGLCVAYAALAALLMMQARSKRCGIKDGTVSYLAVLAIPLGVLCARIGYTLIRFDWMRTKGFSFFFQLNQGGYVLYGAALGVLLAAVITGRLTRQPVSLVLDAAAAPAALMIALCRMAEGLVGLGYGRPVADWFDPFSEQSMIVWEDPSVLYRFPFAQKGHYGWNFSIFVPEALAALVICLILLTRKRRAAGGLAALGALLYAACQVILESMRMDELTWGFVKVSQLLSAVTIAGILLICCIRIPKRERTALRIGGAWALTLGCCGVVTAMEFALDQKIGFLKWMRMDVCYAVMALACAGFVFTVLPLWRRAFPLEEKA